MNRYTVAVCDDAPRQREQLAALVQRWAAHSGREVRTELFADAAAYLFCHEESAAVDILLLDIEMPGMNGVELARTVREKDSAVQLVFITGYMEYLAEGYDVEALHYLLKPVEEEKLFAVLERAAQRLAERRRSLLVTTAGETLRLPLHEIRFIEVQGNYVTLHAESPHTLRTTLKELAPQLDAAFFRTHRAFIVNLRFVRRATKTQVFLKDGTQVPLARGQYDALARALIAYF
ncbi:MAG: response regulator transcription factor [Oscillospiraceae bacterium]|nr:response regulator transcription factor [Oscillospiraceae bacterium]